MVFSTYATNNATQRLPANCSSSEALLEVLFDAGVSSTAVQEGGMRVSLIVPSNGTEIDAVQFHKGDLLANLSMCLPEALCYGLELINAWRGHYQIRYDGTPIPEAAQQQFPYYMRAPQAAGNNSGTPYTPYESNLTFVEFGRGASCVPRCDPDSEALYEVRIFGGNNGEASLSWRIEQEENEVEGNKDQDDVDKDGDYSPGATRRWMGCEDDPAGDLCGNSYDVRVSRSCLPKSADGCVRFVMGNPNVVPSEGPDSMQGEGLDEGTSDSRVPPSIQGAGHYHPTFRVSVDGTVVAEGTSPTFTSTEIGSGCSRCDPNEQALLEIFQYRTGPVDYSLRDLQSDQLVSRSSASSSALSSDMLRYERRCVRKERCYDLAFESSDAPFDAPVSVPVTDGVSTQVILDGVYFANALVRDVPFRAILGGDCARQPACSANESLVSVGINTTGGTGTFLNGSLYLPSYYCAWSIFDLNDPPKQRLPEVSTRYFANGYPSGSLFRHSMCVPDEASSSLMFGMLNSVPSDVVAWTVELNGNAPLDCRLVHDGNSPEDYWRDYIRTPLDGSCQAGADSSSGDQGLSPTLKFVVGLSVGIFVPVAALAIAVYFFSFGEDRASTGRPRRRRDSLSISSLSSDRSPPGMMAFESESVEDCGSWPAFPSAGDRSDSDGGGK